MPWVSCLSKKGEGYKIDRKEKEKTGCERIEFDLPVDKEN